MFRSLSRVCVVVFAAMGAPVSVLAQAAEAETARTAFAEAVRAYRAGDTAAAATAMGQAAETWPGQWVYLFNAAALAARQRDTVRALGWLERFATMGLWSPTFDQHEAFALLQGHPRYEALAARVIANGAPMPRSIPALTIPDSTLYPEGVARDPGTGAWYLTSVLHGMVIRVRGTTVDTLVPGAVTGGSTLGIAADPGRNALWVTAAALPRFASTAPGRSWLMRFHLTTGQPTGRWELPPEEDHHLGDLTLGPDGTVYVTDSRAPIVWRLRPGASALDTLIADPSFRSLQGITLHPDGRTLFLADWSHGLFRLDLPTRRLTWLPPPPDGTTLGIDGLYWVGDGLVGIQNGVVPPRIVRLALSPDGTRVRSVTVVDRHLPLADEPTLGVVDGKTFWYVANSQWDKYDDEGRRIAGTHLAPAVVLRLEP